MLKRYNFRVRIKVLGIKVHCLYLVRKLSSQTLSFLKPLLMFFRSMMGLFHKSYFFSMRYKKTQHSSIPLFHHSKCACPPSLSLRRGGRGRSELNSSNFMPIFSDKDEVSIKFVGAAKVFLKYVFAKWVDSL